MIEGLKLGNADISPNRNIAKEAEVGMLRSFVKLIDDVLQIFKTLGVCPQVRMAKLRGSCATGLAMTPWFQDGQERHQSLQVHRDAAVYPADQGKT